MKKILKHIFMFISFVMLFTSCKFEKKASITEHYITLRLSENHVRGTPAALADEEFARLVEEKTGGKVKVEALFGGALTETSEEAVEALKNGDIAFTRLSSSVVTSYVPRFAALQLPYLYRSSEHMWKVLNGKLGQELLADIERSGSGLVGLCYYDAGSRNFYSTKEIRSIADLKDLRIRVQGQLMADMCAALGAVGVKGIGMTEVRSNLESGFIDAAENNWNTYQSTGDFTAAKYYILDQHTRLPELLVASKKVLSSLKPQYVEAIKEAAKLAQEYEIQKWHEKEAAAEQIVRSNRNKVIELSPAVISEFQLAMQPLYDKYGSKYRDVISTIQATN